MTRFLSLLIIQEEGRGEIGPAFYIILLFSIGITLILIMKRRRALAERERGPSIIEEGLKTAPYYTRIKDELDSLFLQIQEAANDYVARLDTKIKIAQGLLAEIDKGREELKMLIKELERVRKLAPKTESPKEPPRPIVNPLHSKVMELRNQKKSTAEIAKEAGLTEGEVELIIGHYEVR